MAPSLRCGIGTSLLILTSLMPVQAAEDTSGRSAPQAAMLAASPGFVGSMPQVASGGGWKTTFTIVNTGTVPASIRLNFWANDGKELILPTSFPQTPGGGATQGSTLDRTIDAGASLIVESEAAASSPILVGWAELLSAGQVNGLAVFRQKSPDGREQEASVPLEIRTASGYLLQFDNTAGYATGIAVANNTAAYVVFTVTQRDDAGKLIGTETLPLASRGHDSFDLKTKWPALAGKRGTIEVKGTVAGGISILGLRFHPQGPFTTLPVAGR